MPYFEPSRLMPLSLHAAERGDLGRDDALVDADDAVFERLGARCGRSDRVCLAVGSVGTTGPQVSSFNARTPAAVGIQAGDRTAAQFLEQRPGCRAHRKSPEEWLAEVNRCERDGELFRAYDIAMRGLSEYPDALALKHRAVLCLASTKFDQDPARWTSTSSGHANRNES